MDAESSRVPCCFQDFPYYVQDGISHDNIWATTPLTTEQLIKVSLPTNDGMCSTMLTELQHISLVHNVQTRLQHYLDCYSISWVMQLMMIIASSYVLICVFNSLIKAACSSAGYRGHIGAKSQVHLLCESRTSGFHSWGESHLLRFVQLIPFGST